MRTEGDNSGRHGRVFVPGRKRCSYRAPHRLIHLFMEKSSPVRGWIQFAALEGVPPVAACASRVEVAKPAVPSKNPPAIRIPAVH